MGSRRLDRVVSTDRPMNEKLLVICGKMYGEKLLWSDSIDSGFLQLDLRWFMTKIAGCDIVLGWDSLGRACVAAPDRVLRGDIVVIATSDAPLHALLSMDLSAFGENDPRDGASLPRSWRGGS